MKRILMGAAAAAMFIATQAAAGDIAVPYQERKLGDSEVRKLWADLANDAKPLGGYSPWALVATIPIGDGRTLTVTQLWAGGLCTGQSCPLRVYEGDEKLVDEMACDTDEDHQITDDGRILTACDTAIRINRR